MTDKQTVAAQAATKKLEALKQSLAAMHSVLVAYSGGVDSTFLLKVARDVLGSRVLAATASSPTYPAHETDAAIHTAEELGVELITLTTDEFADPHFRENSPQRCYWCKKELFSRLKALAASRNLNCVLDGANADDTSDFRPGSTAAAELGIRSPLKEAALSKAEIRRLSQQLGLSTWDKPSFACLASRFPYGTEITADAVQQVASAEAFLRDLGIRQMRVRHHADTARIEVLPDDMHLVLDEETRKTIVDRFKALGYSYIALDLQGYRTGSMNEVLEKKS